MGIWLTTLSWTGQSGIPISTERAKAETVTTAKIKTHHALRVNFFNDLEMAFYNTNKSNVWEYYHELRHFFDTRRGFILYVSECPRTNDPRTGA